MPLIQPPKDNDTTEPVEQNFTDEQVNQRIKDFLDVQPWRCPLCDITNFGRNELCANWKCKTPRPESFVIRGKNE